VTWGWLPQRAGLPSLNGGGTAAGVLPTQHRLYGRRFYRPKDPTNSQRTEGKSYKGKQETQTTK